MDESVEVEVQIQIGVLENLLANPVFADKIRTMLTKNVRGLGDLYATKANREPRPRNTQPNTQQRIW